MSKELRCSDLMPGCSFVAKGNDDGEVLKKAAEHAKKDHNMASISPDMEKKVRGAIRSV